MEPQTNHLIRKAAVAGILFWVSITRFISMIKIVIVDLMLINNNNPKIIFWSSEIITISLFTVFCIVFSNILGSRNFGQKNHFLLLWLALICIFLFSGFFEPVSRVFMIRFIKPSDSIYYYGQLKQFNLIGIASVISFYLKLAIAILVILKHTLRIKTQQ